MKKKKRALANGWVHSEYCVRAKILLSLSFISKKRNILHNFCTACRQIEME